MSEGDTLEARSPSRCDTRRPVRWNENNTVIGKQESPDAPLAQRGPPQAADRTALTVLGITIGIWALVVFSSMANKIALDE
jgi:hypothetical protein